MRSPFSSENPNPILFGMPRFATMFFYTALVTLTLPLVVVEKAGEHVKGLHLGLVTGGAALLSVGILYLFGMYRDRECRALQGASYPLYGLALFHTGQHGRSIEVLDQAIEMYPDAADAVCYRGQVEGATKAGSRSAEDYFRRALQLRPGYAEALYQWARFAMNRDGSTKDDLDSARVRLTHVLEMEPLNSKAHSRLGMLYYYLGHLDLAEKSYRTALALNPADYNTRYNLGELYCTKVWNNKELPETTQRELRRKAMEQFKLALDLDSSHAEAHFKIGLLSLENNMDNAAVLHLEKARVLAPANIRFLLQLGVAYEKKKQPDQALSVYNEILDIDPVNEVAQQKVRLLSNTNV